MNPSLKGLQLFPYPLRAPTFAVGGVDIVSLDVLPKTQFGRIAHLAGFSFDVRATPTISGGGTATVFGQNNLVEKIQFCDGFSLRFNGSFNTLRYREMLEFGAVEQPDPDDVATGELSVYERWLGVGPNGYAGNPSDFLFPCAALENGELRFNFLSAASRYSANASALTSSTVQIYPVAWLAFLDGELRIPPAFEFTEYTLASSDTTINGRALYTDVGIVDTLATPGTAISAGDFSAFQIDTGSGQTPQLGVSVLTKGFYSVKGSRHINGVQGEPLAATDDDSKMVNGGTPTALTGSSAVIQPLLYSPPNARISKQWAMAESGLRIKWSGSQTQAGAVVGRILAQPASQYGAIAGKALANLGLTAKDQKIKTLTKDMYRGPRGEFMPIAIKV